MIIFFHICLEIFKRIYKFKLTIIIYFFFFCSPVMFGLVKEKLEPAAQRALLLVTKVLQVCTNCWFCLFFISHVF